MNKIKLIIKVLLLFSFLTFVACQELPSTLSESDDNTPDKIEGTGETAFSVSVEIKEDHEEEGDYTWESSSVTQVTLNGSTIQSDSDGVSINGSTVTIIAYGNYEFTGWLSDGQIIVDIDENIISGIDDLGKSNDTNSDDIVRLILNGVDISNTSTSPIYIVNSKKTIIVLNTNTENLITDGSSYSFTSTEEDEPNAALFSKDNITIFGNGSLTVTGNYNDGIASKDGLIIKSGNISINAVDDGIRGKDYVITRGGNTIIKAEGDAIKSDNEEDDSCGYVSIESGTLNITCSGDGITAQTNALISGGKIAIKSGGGSSNFNSLTSSKGIKAVSKLVIDDGTISINSADDALHSNHTLTINGGDFSLSTGDDAVHADNTVTINKGTIEITKCVEGVEGNYIVVNDGEIHVNSSDDSFNSSAGTRTERDDNSCTYINGGYIVLSATNGDGLDSNGDLEMTAGTVVIHGPSRDPEVMIDYNGTFNISGGLLTSSGSSSRMTQAPSSSSSQCAVKVMFNSSKSTSTLFHIEDASGNDVVTFQPAHRYQSIVFSSSDLLKGNTYKIYTGGSSTGTETDGLYTGGTYSGGTLYRSFTISNIVTTIN